MTLAHRVAARLDALAPAGASCLVAVSGGTDSLALLDLLVLGAEHHRRPLVVGHVDHGIAAASGEVAERVRRAAAGYGLPYVVERLALGVATSETVARAARRGALRRLAAVGGARRVLLAHQAEDQAETILLRLLRGSGPAGLAGMAARRGLWLRPLLEVGRSELVAHLATREITPWEDPANADPRHLRSWLRREILPRLAERLPDVADRLREAGRHARELRAAWDDMPEGLAALEMVTEPRGISVAAPVLQGYRSPLRRAVLAALGRRFGVPLGRRRMEAIERLLDAPEGGVVHLDRRLRAELAFGRLTFEGTRTPEPPPVALAASGETGFGSFRFRSAPGGAAPTRDGWRTTLPAGTWRIRAWRAGDRIRPLGGTGTRAVAVLLREARIAPGRRRRWPVVVDDDATIVWVPGICRADARIPESGTETLDVDCADG